MCAGQCEDPGPFPLPWECTWAEPSCLGHPVQALILPTLLETSWVWCGGKNLSFMWSQHRPGSLSPCSADGVDTPHYENMLTKPEQMPLPSRSFCHTLSLLCVSPKSINSLILSISRKNQHFFCCVTISNTLQRWDTEYFFIKGIFNILVSLIENITAFVPGVPLPWQVFPLLILAQVL